MLGIDAGEIDLRRDEFRFARTFDAVKVALATGVTLVFFGFFLFAFTAVLERDRVNKQREQLRALMEKQLRVDVIEEYEKTVKDARKETESERAKSKDLDQYFQRTKTRLNDIRNHLKNELGLATEVPPIRSCLEAWSTVMTCVKEVRGKITYMAITEEKYTQEKADLKVVFGDIPDVDVLVRELRKHDDIFESVENGQMRVVKDKGVEFPIKIVIKQKETVVPPKDDDAAAADSAAAPVADTPAAAPDASSTPAANPAATPPATPPVTPPAVAPAPGAPAKEVK